MSQARITCCLLVGKMKKKDRTDVLSNLENGNISVVIGTHALIQEDVVFKELGSNVIEVANTPNGTNINDLLKKVSGTKIETIIEDKEEQDEQKEKSNLKKTLYISLFLNPEKQQIHMQL